MNFSYFAQEIKERLSTKEVISFYGVNINSRGFANCQFHREKTASFKVYDGDKGYHCFGCGKTGDIIAFVQEYFGMSFVEAVKKLNEDFALGLPIDKKISKSRRLEAAKKAFNRRQSIKKWEKEQQRLEDEYWKCFDECFRLSCQIETYKPKTMDEEWHPLYVDGVQNITYSQYLLECAESARYEHERTNRCG